MRDTKKIGIIVGVVVLVGLGIWGLVSTDFWSSTLRGLSMMTSSPDAGFQGHGAGKGGFPGGGGAGAGGFDHREGGGDATVLAGFVKVAGYAAVMALVAGIVALTSRLIRRRTKDAKQS